ncbi:MAG: lysophospholipid acyltransferase family protein [Bacteroidota bacterium]|nr:lysophospholipid acyltransferase family protein [Bacteroidota bacterium]
MQLLLYLAVYPLLWTLSVLPFRVLYLISDCCFVLIYYIVGYRRKVVNSNIKMALPHLSDKEVKEVEKKSYRHLCDMFLEMIKTLSISTSEIEKRFVFTNLDIYKKLEQDNKSIVLLCTHYASYEWVISMNRHVKFKGYAIYKKINNKYFDKLVKKIRQRFDANLIHIHETGKIIKSNEEKNIKGVYGFASDQSPQLRKKNHWDSFMGIEVPIYVGVEQLAKHFDMNAVYLNVIKTKRGHYEATFEVLSTNVKELDNYELMRLYLDRVEKQIRQKPEYYLWTHRRWKHHSKKNQF